MRIGAHYLGKDQCEFVVWSPPSRTVAVRLLTVPEKIIGMERTGGGYWRTTVDGLSPKVRYRFLLDDERELPDPASRYQPEGVHGPSEIVDHEEFSWTDPLWKGSPISEWITYELHVGAFTSEGTFEAVIPRLAALKEIGINAIEIMPVAQFPGERNWGYDGVYPFAVQNSYGGPEGLKKLVDGAHQQGIAVVLDVVYNHLGPEGNYMGQYGPYFTDRYKTPWGSALNFDQADCDGVRNFFIENALYWFENFHIDGLRLDAIHAICDFSAKPFLQELADRVRDYSHQSGRIRYLIAETDQNDVKVIKPAALGGYGLHAQWCDDFHHALHSIMTGETDGYYQDYGGLWPLIKSFREGYAYSGEFSSYRRRLHGNSSKDRPADQFVVFSQNHDHVGNRLGGERLSHLLSLEGQKVAAGLVLFSPYLPLLFMGEEYGERSPFFYFVHHSDPDLIQAVQEGRKNEFKAFGWTAEPPDPQSEETFLRSKLNWESRKLEPNRRLLEFYQTMIRLRCSVPSLNSLNKDALDVWSSELGNVIFMRRWSDHTEVLCLFNLSGEDHELHPSQFNTSWDKILDSSEAQWGGPGTHLPKLLRGFSFAIYQRKTS